MELTMEQQTEQQTTIQKDGAYFNAVSGIGTQLSKTQHNGVNLAERKFLTMQELSQMYELDGIAAKIVNCVVDDAFGNGFEIANDGDGSIQKELNSIGFTESMQLAALYSRLYGGAIIVMRLRDGLKINEPAGKGEIIGFDVFSIAKVSISSADFESDINNVNYGKLNKVHIDIGAENVEVNISRCFIVKGELVPDGDRNADVKARYFGSSTLNSINEKLAALGISFTAVEDAMQEFKVSGYKLNDLALMLSRPDGGKRDLENRFAAINLGKSMCRAVVLDKEDEYFTQESNFSGIPDILLKIMQLIAASADIPMAKLYGESASGLASTGEGDRMMYDQKVNSWRMRTIYLPMCKMIEEYTERKGGVKCNEIVFNPVSVPSTKQFVEMCKAQADTMKIYFEMGVLTPDEIRKMVFEGGHSFNMNI